MKPGSRFVSIVGDFTDSTVTARKIFSQVGSILGRSISSFLSRSAPSYTFTLANPAKDEDYAILRACLEEGSVKPIIEKEFEFTTDGVRSMIDQMETCRTVGKLVLRINAPYEVPRPVGTSM